PGLSPHAGARGGHRDGRGGGPDPGPCGLPRPVRVDGQRIRGLPRAARPGGRGRHRSGAGGRHLDRLLPHPPDLRPGPAGPSRLALPPRPAPRRRPGPVDHGLEPAHRGHRRTHRRRARSTRHGAACGPHGRRAAGRRRQRGRQRCPDRCRAGAADSEDAGPPGAGGREWAGLAARASPALTRTGRPPPRGPRSPGFAAAPRRVVLSSVLGAPHGVQGTGRHDDKEATFMRANYLGLFAYTLVLAGIAGIGVWLVLLATAGRNGAWIPGVIGAVLLLAGGGLLLAVRLYGRQDPLEPAPEPPPEGSPLAEADETTTDAQR